MVQTEKVPSMRNANERYRMLLLNDFYLKVKKGNDDESWKAFLELATTEITEKWGTACSRVINDVANLLSCTFNHDIEASVPLSNGRELEKLANAVNDFVVMHRLQYVPSYLNNC